MKRILSSVLLIAALFALPAAAQTRLAGGSIAAQVLGRVRVNADFSVNLYGYFTAMEGMPGSVFNGTPSENTAFFTFVAQPTGAAIFRNGDIVHGLENPANGQYTTLTIYYNAGAAGRDFSNPDDFAQGIVIGTFRSRTAAVNVLPGSGFQASAGLSSLSSNFFFLNGQPVNLSNIVNALSLTLSGPAATFDSILAALTANGNFMIPFSGTAIAAGQ